MFLISQLLGRGLPPRSLLPMFSPRSMDSGVTQCWYVWLCLPMPGGMPGIAPMSISILYSYMPGFTLPLKRDVERTGGGKSAGENGGECDAEAGVSGHVGSSSDG